MKQRTKGNGIVLCLRPGCEHEALSRGLCRSCYAAAAACVRRGQTTWKDLEAAGKILPVGTQGVRGAAAKWFQAR